MLYAVCAGSEGRIRSRRSDLIYLLVPNELDVTPNFSLQQGESSVDGLHSYGTCFEPVAFA